MAIVRVVKKKLLKERRNRVQISAHFNYINEHIYIIL